MGVGSGKGNGIGAKLLLYESVKTLSTKRSMKLGHSSCLLDPFNCGTLLCSEQGSLVWLFLETSGNSNGNIHVSEKALVK